jgi:hypothetical protein
VVCKVQEADDNEEWEDAWHRSGGNGCWTHWGKGRVPESSGMIDSQSFWFRGMGISA